METETGRITAIRAGKKAGKRLSIFLDGRFAFSLSAQAAGDEGLAVGQELPPNRVTELTSSDGSRRCLDAAMRLLGYRARSEAEMRERLRRRDFTDDSIDAVITRLKSLELIDDAAFARSWQENRDAFKPRSGWLTGLELRKKGVPEDVIASIVSDANDSEAADRAARTRADRLAVSDYEAFRRRLGDFLRRRGFGYEVINQTVSRLWRERTTSIATKQRK